MGFRERDTQVNEARKRPYKAFTCSDIERLQQWQQRALQEQQWQLVLLAYEEWRARLEAQAQLVTQLKQQWAQEVGQAAGDDDHEKWAAKYLGWRLPAGYRVDTTLVMQDRVVLLCLDGRVLILDTSRM